MDRWWRILVGGLAVLSGSCTVPDEDEGLRAMDRLREDHLESLLDGSIERYLSVFADGAVFMVPDGKTEYGPDGIERAVRPFFDDWITEEEETPRETVVRDDVGFEWGLLRVTMRPRAGGPSATSVGKYLFFARRDPVGHWHYSHMIWNGDLPANASAATRDRRPRALVDHAPRVARLIERLRTAQAAADSDGVLDCQTADVVWMPPGYELLDGPDAVRRWVRLRGPERREYVVEEAVVARDVALVRGQFARPGWTAPNKFLMVLRDLGQGWRVARWLWTP